MLFLNSRLQLKHLILLFFGLIFLSANPVFAEENPVQTPIETPTEWSTEVILVSLGEVNKKSQTFWASFAVIITHDDPEVDFTKTPPGLSFMNSKNTSLSDEHITPNTYEVTVRGTFFSKMDFRAFPFNNLFLQIFIEPKTPNTAEKVYFSTKQQQFDAVDSNFHFSGWNLKNILSNTPIHDYGEGFRFSRLVLTYEIEKEALGTIIKTLFPVTLIMLVCLLSFFVKGNYSSKIYLTVVLLYPLVYLHLAIVRDLPETSYLTYFDKIMVIYYLLFLNSIIKIIRQMRSHFNTNEHALAHRQNLEHVILIPVIIIFVMIALF